MSVRFVVGRAGSGKTWRCLEAIRARLRCDPGAGGKLRNGPYNWNEMIQYYHDRDYTNVNGVRIWRNIDAPDEWPVILGPQSGQGWVRPEWQSPTTGCLFYLPYPIIRSTYSNRLIDLKNGIYDGAYNGQPSLKFIKMPNLNNHGIDGNQDYAGVTSAVPVIHGISLRLLRAFSSRRSR